MKIHTLFSYIRPTICLMVLLTGFLSCVKDNSLQSSDYYAANSRTAHSRKVARLLSKQGEGYDVTEEEALQYAENISRIKGGHSYGNVISVDPIYYEDEFLAGYTINFENGWQIISSDKRGPVVLAKSKKGYFSFEETNENTRLWLSYLFDDIRFRKESPEQYYQYLDKEGLDNERLSNDFWDSILNHRLDDYETKPPPLIPPGRYQYEYTYTTSVGLDTLSHLLNTNWHQHTPYNSFCPMKSITDTTRCPAGCVTIAGAQVLYYLHNYLGIPQYSPSEGYCIGFVNNYSFSFYNYSPSTWGVMDSIWDTQDYRGLLIGSVATLSDVDFGVNGSSSTVEKLKNGAFAYYGVYGNYSTSYDRDTMYHNIEDGLPVIFDGNRYESFLNYPGHAWIIDGYVIETIMFHDVYEWHYLEEPTVPVPSYDPFEITYTAPSLKYFRMKWGWGNYYHEDDADYLTDGSWVNPLHPDYNPYNYDKEMFTRFH